IRGIKPSLHPLIEPEDDHAAQALAMPGEQDGPAFPVTVGHPMKQLGGVTGVLGFHPYHVSLIALPVGSVTEKSCRTAQVSRPTGLTSFPGTTGNDQVARTPQASWIHRGRDGSATERTWRTRSWTLPVMISSMSGAHLPGMP